MKDKFSKEKRSGIMSKIRKTDTKHEISTRKFLFSEGLRYRIYNKKLIGNPDIVLTKYKTVVFVNGCFWHAHNNCKLNRKPKSNKIELTEAGWRVLIVWECELSKVKREETLTNLYNKIIEYNN